MKLFAKPILLSVLITSISIANSYAQKKPTPNVKANPAATSAKPRPSVIPEKNKKTTLVLKNSIDSLSYAIGVNIGDNLRGQKINANTEILAAAISEALKDSKSVMTSEQCGTYIQSYFQKQTSKAGDENKKKSDTFLAANRSKEGVKITESGLQYKVLTQGTGNKPAATDQVKVHYHGTLIDGTVFDSSVNRGEPATFGVSQVIKGWVEALQLMEVGSKWTLYIPSELAYGAQGPPSIGPNQALVFDVELLDIVKQ
jgi:FKBP-type peptidyl-prolyl cis-trans isomerase FklB